MKVPLLCLIAHAMSKPADSILGTDFGSFLINPWDYILKWSPTTDHPSPFLNVNGDQTKNHLLLTTTRLIGLITLYSGGLDQPIDLAHKRFYNILDPAEGYMMPNQYKVNLSTEERSELTSMRKTLKIKNSEIPVLVLTAQ